MAKVSNLFLRSIIGSCWLRESIFLWICVISWTSTCSRIANRLENLTGCRCLFTDVLWRCLFVVWQRHCTFKLGSRNETICKFSYFSRSGKEDIPRKYDGGFLWYGLRSMYQWSSEEIYLVGRFEEGYRFKKRLEVAFFLSR